MASRIAPWVAPHRTALRTTTSTASTPSRPEGSSWLLGHAPTGWPARRGTAARKRCSALSGDVGAGVGQVVADRRRGNAEGPADADGGQLAAVHEAVHGHLRHPHDPRDLGHGQEADRSARSGLVDRGPRSHGPGSHGPLRHGPVGHGTEGGALAGNGRTGENGSGGALGQGHVGSSRWRSTALGVPSATLCIRADTHGKGPLEVTATGSNAETERFASADVDAVTPENGVPGGSGGGGGCGAAVPSPARQGRRSGGRMT